MRVTERMRIDQSAFAMKQSGKQMYELNGIASSGNTVGRPSSDPATYARIAAKEQKISGLEARDKALERVIGDLGIAEGALASASGIVVRMRELAVQFADGDTQSTTPGDIHSLNRQAAANELALMRQELAALANSKGARGYLFAGSATDTAPIDAGFNFVANDDAIEVEMADRQRATANLDGQQAFTGTIDVFAVVDQFITDLGNDDQVAIRARIDDLDQAHQQVVAVRADAGVKINRFESARDVTAQALLVTTKTKSELKEGDLTKIFSELSQAQLAYERSVAVTRQVLAMASAVERF